MDDASITSPSSDDLQPGSSTPSLSLPAQDEEVATPETPVSAQIDSVGPDSKRRFLNSGLSLKAVALFSGLIVVFAALDQLSKAWALSSLRSKPVEVFWTLQLHLVKNAGAAFSVGQDSTLLKFLPVLVLVAVICYSLSSPVLSSKLGIVAAAMVTGGALGNLIDRLFRSTTAGFLSGRVVDFIDFQWWPIFNVADMFVVVGACLLAVDHVRRLRVQTAEAAPDAEV